MTRDRTDALVELVELIELDRLADLEGALRADASLVHARTADGDVLLHVACWRRRAAIVEHLLSAGAAVDARGCYGRTPLHYAVHEGGSESVAIVRALLAAGADPKLRDDSGYTPAQWAAIEISDPDALDAVLALFERVSPGATAQAKHVAAPAMQSVDFDAVRAHTRDIEARSHTALALHRLFAAFCEGAELDAAAATEGIGSADLACIEDAKRALDAIATTSWADPLRGWLSEEGATPSTTEWVARYYERSR